MPRYMVRNNNIVLKCLEERGESRQNKLGCLEKLVDLEDFCEKPLVSCVNWWFGPCFISKCLEKTQKKRFNH